MQQTFEVTGMHCQHCVRAVTEAVEDLDPAAEVAVDLGAGRVAVGSGLPRDTLRRAIEAAGYPAT